MLRIFNFFIATIARYLYAIAANFNKNIKNDFLYIELSMVCCDKIKNSRLFEVILYIEDRRFLTHKGIDLRGIIRAFYKTLLCNRLEGGSTIEQQYVRLITNRREINLKRKIRECILAAKLSYTYPKYQILNSYLSNHYFINNIKGLDQLAVKENFSIKNLNDDQISYLVARLKYPFVNNNNFIYLKRVAIIKAAINSLPFIKQRRSISSLIDNFKSTNL